jgi:glycerol kinase
MRCREVLDALRADSPREIDVLRVDGGAARNDFLMQCQADVTGIPVERPAALEAASVGIAYLAGLAAGFWKDVGEVARTWRRERLFEPRTTADERGEAFATWKKRVDLARGGR